MAEEYYILEDGEKKGPYSFKELIHEGIDLDTQILAPGTDTWQSASYLPQFVEYFSSLGYLFPTEDNLASPSIRLGAFFIDYIILSIISGLIIIKMGLIHISDSTKFNFEELTKTVSVRDQLLMELVIGVMFLLFNILAEVGGMRGSVGKRICGLAVVDADGKGLSITKSLARSAGAVTCYVFLFPLGAIIAIISFFAGKHYQTWYERLTDTYVIRVR